MRGKHVLGDNCGSFHLCEVRIFRNNFFLLKHMGLQWTILHSEILLKKLHWLDSNIMVKLSKFSSIHFPFPILSHAPKASSYRISRYINCYSLILDWLTYQLDKNKSTAKTTATVWHNFIYIISPTYICTPWLSYWAQNYAFYRLKLVSLVP